MTTICTTIGTQPLNVFDARMQAGGEAIVGSLSLDWAATVHLVRL